MRLFLPHSTLDTPSSTLISLLPHSFPRSTLIPILTPSFPPLPPSFSFFHPHSTLDTPSSTLISPLSHSFPLPPSLPLFPRYLIQKVGTLHDYTPGLVKQAQKSYVTYINTILFLRINVKKQKDCEGEKSGSYSHAGLSLERLIQHAAEISLFS